MPEVTTIEWKHLSVLAGMALTVRYSFSDLTSERKQRKACKWLSKQFGKQISALPNDLRSILSPENSDQSVLDFLRACREECDLRIKENRTPQALILAPLGEEVQRAVHDLQEEDCGVGIEHLEDGRIALVVDDSSAWRRSIILENAVLSPQCSDWRYWGEMPEVTREGDTYILRSLGADKDMDVLCFTGAYVEVTSYNCTCEQFFVNNPWDCLHALAWCIKTKAAFPGDHCNDREKTLLPLLKEIMMIGIKDPEHTYPLLTQLAREVGCDPLKVEKTARTWNQKNWNQVSRVLCGKEWEPLWREVYRRICHSQEGYPVRVEQCCKAEDLQKTRSALEEYFHSQGFSGQYPDFVKTGPISGVHLEESYDLVYFVANEKDASMYISCVETLGLQDRVAVQFICGIALKEKGREPLDLVSCQFDRKGRTYFRWVRDYDSFYTQEDQPLERILHFARIAVKKVQLEKLTKEEKSHYSFGAAEGLAWFWIWLLVGGGLFAAAMVAAFWVMGAVVMALFGYGDQIIPALSSVPWHYMLAFCWIGFGLPMGIISLIAKWK